MVMAKSRIATRSTRSQSRPRRGSTRPKAAEESIAAAASAAAERATDAIAAVAAVLGDEGVAGAAEAGGGADEPIAEEVESVLGGGEAAESDKSPGPVAGASPAVPAGPRFRIFVIDSGWHSVAPKAMRENLPLFHALTGDDPIYVLDQAMSVALLRRHQELIGQDPIICVHDIRKFEQTGGTDGVHGIRMHLGHLHTEQAVAGAMQMLVQFLIRHRMADDIEALVRTNLRREGIAGAIKIMAGGAAEHEFLGI